MKKEIAEEISPKNYYQTQGWVSHTNTPIVCLPNGIKIELINTGKRRGYNNSMNKTQDLRSLLCYGDGDYGKYD